MVATQTRRTVPAWAPPAALIAALTIGVVAVLLLARRSAAPDVPPEPAPFEAPASTRPVTTLDVQQAGGGRFALSDGSRDVSPAPGARVEVLRPASPIEIRAGDWLAVIGIPNEVRNFSIRSLVVIPSPSAPNDEAVVRSPGGFAGHEASRDLSERTILGGVVTSVTGERIELRGPTGPLSVSLTAGAPLRRLSEGQVAEIREGDRIAYPDGGPLASAGAVLVLPGGAR